jgi:hypothetical protein
MAERRGPKPQHKVALTAPEFRQLQRLTRRRTAPYAEVVRAKIVDATETRVRTVVAPTGFEPVFQR